MTEKKQVHFSVVAPIFPVRDMKRSVSYYQDKLLFSIGFKWSENDADTPSYVILIKDDTELHLTKSSKPNKTAAYFFLKDVQSYYKDIMYLGATVVNDIEDQPWQMREFEVSDPDGNAIIFGESIEDINN